MPPVRPFLAAVSVLLVGVLANAGPAHAADPPPRVDNPYAGARVYVNPEWAARAAAEPGGATVAGQPTAVWLDRIARIEGTDGVLGLRGHLDAALAQGADLVQLTLYNLPARDCGRRAPQGELSIDDTARYEAEFVDPIVEILAAPRYADLRIVAFVEPNSLPNLVVNTGIRYTATPACDEVLARGTYQQGIGYALARLGTVPNVYPYLDISHHGEVGWPEDSAPLTALLLQAATAAGSTVANVHGFVANTANYSVLREEHFRADDVVNGQPVYQSRWVDWNPFVDEVPYARHMRALLTEVGFSPQVGVVVDTSRNGWGGPGRPTGPATAGDVNRYVDGSRIDRRAYVGNWCNQVGSGLGQRPAAEPEPGIDAYAWVKPPGESDGSAGSPTPGLPYEPLCDPNYLAPRSSPYATGAMPAAPPIGEWFPAHFRQLLTNAWPPL
ncbi:glycoside hydrolase family 6 protein [Micromonospora sp. NPDC049230]|uniref:glycoside hydrolase family 6 protein n=1 Tax=Micromonospora sp. NPDC049230 TaxID=3155502 RepID=UPI0033DFA65E